MKSYPYIIAVIISTLLAIAVWTCLPPTYNATLKFSDEEKEMDLAIGLNSISAKVKEMTGMNNSGMNSLFVYCKILESEDFAKTLAHKIIPSQNIQYGTWVMQQQSWWQSKDTIASILDHIEYNTNRRESTLKLQVSDVNPVVASEVLDIVVNELQNQINKFKREQNQRSYKLAVDRRTELENRYIQAQEEYATFADSHLHINKQEFKQQEQFLKNNLLKIQERIDQETEQCIRYKSLLTKDTNSFTIILGNTVPIEPKTTFWPILFAFVFVAIMLAKAYCAFNSWDISKLDLGGYFSPWTITFGIWMVIGISLYFSGNLLDPPTDTFYTAISLWIPILCVTSFVTYNLTPTNLKQGTIEINEVLFNGLFVIAMIITPLYLYQIYKLLSMFDSRDIMLNARELAVKGDGFGFLNYTFVVNEVLLLTAIWRYPKIQGWKLACIFVACFLYAVGNMEKITMFLIFISSAFVLFERGVIKIRTIIIIASFLLLIFYVFNLARSGEDSDYSKNESLLDFIGMYILSAPVAFCRLHRTISDTIGSDTLWGLYLYADKYFGGSFTPHSPFMDFVWVPISTNVFTIMRPFYTDFGFYGVSFFAFIYGIVSGYTYKLMKNRHSFGTCIYTYFVYALVLQFFDEFITAGLPLFTQMLILLWLLTQQRFKIRMIKK